MIKLIAPKNGAQISILTDVQREFIRREREGITKSSESYGWISHDMASGRNLSYPAAVMFQWSCDDPTSKMNFEISLNSDFIESESRRGKIASVGMARASAGENGLYFLIADNLLSGETYYWRVNEGDGKGETFFTPESHPAPVSVYGRTKYQGETAVQAALDKYFIVRISWVFGLYGKNFVKTMIDLAGAREEIGVVCDQIGSPTYTKHLAPLLLDMAQSEKYGVYHATNSGVCSWFDFACEIFRLTGQTVRVRALSSEAYPSKARRPKNSRLSKKKLAAMGFSPLPEWQEALRDFIAEYYWEDNGDGKDQD